MLCGCLRPPTSLDIEFDRDANVFVNAFNGADSDFRTLAFTMETFRDPNFDFIPQDNGNYYIAKFRASKMNEVVGCDSKPIPKEVFETFRIIKKQKRRTVYCVDMDTGGVALSPYFDDPDTDNIDLGPGYETFVADCKKI